MRVSSCFCWIFFVFSRVGSMRMSWTTIEGISHFCPAFFRHSLFSYMHAVARLFALSSRFRFAHIRTILYGCLCKTCAYSHADNFYPRFCHHRIRRALTWYILMFIFSEVPEYSILLGCSVYCYTHQRQMAVKRQAQIQWQWSDGISKSEIVRRMCGITIHEREKNEKEEMLTDLQLRY